MPEQTAAHLDSRILAIILAARDERSGLSVEALHAERRHGLELRHAAVAEQRAVEHAPVGRTRHDADPGDLAAALRLHTDELLQRVLVEQAQLAHGKNNKPVSSMCGTASPACVRERSGSNAMPTSSGCASRTGAAREAETCCGGAGWAVQVAARGAASASMHAHSAAISNHIAPSFAHNLVKAARLKREHVGHMNGG
jgi:hypothetical protein